MAIKKVNVFGSYVNEARRVQSMKAPGVRSLYATPYAHGKGYCFCPEHNSVKLVTKIPVKTIDLSKVTYKSLVNLSKFKLHPYDYKRLNIEFARRRAVQRKARSLLASKRRLQRQQQHLFLGDVANSKSDLALSNRFIALGDNVKDEGSNYRPDLRSYRVYKERVPRRPRRIMRDKPSRCVAKRDVKLLYRLRNILRDLRCRRSGMQRDFLVRAVPESDAPGVDGEDNTVQEAVSNVILTTQRDSSTAITASTVPKWSQWTTNDIVDSYSAITDRWYQIHQVTWSKDHAMNHELYRLVLPRQLLRYIETNKEDVSSVPNTIPFKVHAYWRGKIEVKIQVNSNKFQVGQLQAAWYYNDDRNLAIANKRSVYGFSQMEHVLISASASNEATFCIPFKSIYPFLPTSDAPDWESDPLNMGSLSLRVLAPLRMGSAGPSSCSVITFIRLIESEFTGTRTGQMYKAMPEMENFVVPLAEKLLANVVGGSNMDNPPMTQAPQYFVPTGAHSLSLGTNIVEPLHALRLDASGQTQHMLGCAPDEDMTVSSVSRHYGLIRQIQWNKNHTEGSQLLAIDADPFCTTLAAKGVVSTYWIPPVGVIAGNFMYWRGSLEYRFDIIASQFHTGRLIVGYIPGVDAQNAKTINVHNLKSSPYVVFDLQEGNSFTFTVPYVSYRPWWPRRYAGNYEGSATSAPSSIFLMVQVPLIPMESVAESIDINIYMRGGTSFEVSVPVQPCFGLDWNTQFVPREDEKLRALQGYAPYYAGTWHSFNNGNSLVFRWGALSDQIAHFPQRAKDATDGVFYRIVDVNLAAVGTQKWQYMVVWPSGHGYSIGIPTKTNVDARALAKYLYGGGSLTGAEAIKYYVPASEQGEGKYCVGNPAYVAFTAYGDIDELERQKSIELQQISASTEGEDERNSVILDTTTQLAPSGFGQAFFGENFNDLKTLCRRYQLYGQAVLQKQTDKDIDHCLMTFPCLPQGLPLNVGATGSINEIFNRCRDGIIPLVSSGYRYYRGGLRFKIVLPAVQSLNVWVQHRPDRRMKTWTDAKITFSGAVTSGQSIFNHGYASYLQLTRVNNVVEFEVPFYNATCYNLLQSYNKVAECDSYAVSLGEIAVGITASGDVYNELVGRPVLVYYSIADDMQFSSWVGYQPMVILDQLPVGAPTARRALPEGPIDKIRKSFKADISEVVKETLRSVGDEAQTAFERVMDTVEKTEAYKSADDVKRQTIFGIVSNLVHAMMASTYKQVSWSLISLFGHIGLFAMHSMNRARDIFESILKYFGMDKQPQNTSNSGVSCKPESEEDLKARCGAWVSLIFEGVSSMGSLISRKPKSMDQWVKWMTKDLADCTKMSNVVFTFVRNTFEVLKEIVAYVVSFSSGEAWLLRQIETCPEMLRAWVKECLYLDSPQFRLKRADDQQYVDRVFAAQSFGQILLSEIVDGPNSKHLGSLTRIYDRITSLKTDLMQAGSNPFVRKECFTMCITGEPGVGKSFLVDSLCSSLLKAVKTPVRGGLKAVVSPLSEYWDQVEHQPVLAVDDMFAVESEPMLSKQLAMLFLVHSPIVLSPPKADLDGKKMRYNPEIFVYNTNKPFPRFDRIVPEAIYRRRHVLIEVASVKTVAPDYEKKQDCPHCTGDKALDLVDPNLLRDMHHIRLRVADNVCDSATAYSEWMTYDAFLTYLIPIYKQNRVRADKIFRERCAEAEELRDCTRLEGENVLDVYDRLRNGAIEELRNKRVRTFESDISNLASHIKTSFTTTLQRLMPDTSNDKWIPRFTKAPHEHASFTAVPEGYPEQPGYSPFEEDDEIVNDVLDEDTVETCTLLDQLVDQEIITPDLSARISLLMSKYGDDPDRINAWLTPLVGAFSIKGNFTPGSKAISSLHQLWKEGRNAMTRFYYFKNTFECRHLHPEARSIYVVGNTLRMVTRSGRGVEEIDAEQPCDPTCIMHTGVGKYMFYKWWLESNPTLKLQYYRGRGTWPLYMRENPDIVEGPANMWETIKLYLHSIYESKIHPTLRWVWNFLKEYGAIILLVSSVLVGPLTVVGLACMSDGKSSAAQHQWGPVEPEGLKYGETVSPKATRVAKQPQVAKAQGDVQQIAVVEERVRNNMVRVIASLPNGYEVNYRACIIRGRQVLLLRHYYDAWRRHPEGTKYYVTYEFMPQMRLKSVRGIEFKPLERPITQYYGTSKETGVYDTNLLVLDLPIQFPEGKNLTKFFARDKDHWRVQGGGLLVNGKRSERTPIKGDKTIPYLIEDDYTDPVQLVGVYTYPSHGAGMCGTFLLAENLERPIIGVHVAGISGISACGISEPLFQETFEELPLVESAPYDEVEEVVLDSVELSKINLETALYPCGVVPPKLALPQMSTTHIKPSLIHGVFDVKTEPNPLSKRDPRIAPHDPLQLGCEKYGMPTTDFPKKHVDEAARHLTEKLIDNVKPINGCKIRSLQEAVCGIPGVEGYDSISWETSCGFPLSSLKPANEKGKRWCFKMDCTGDGYVLKGLHPELKRLIDYQMSLRENGIKPQTIFSDCLKDTCLPKEKCLIPGKTRVFSISPLQFTIPFRQYFIDFMASYRAARFKAEHGIGINVNSVEWTLLAELLTSKGTKVMTGDYKNYGPSLNLEVAKAAFSCIIAWILHYSEEADKERLKRVLWIMAQEILCAWHLVGNLVFRAPGGIPSGSPITDILNTLANGIYLRCGWIGITSRPLSDFSKHVAVVFYGDDVAANISDEVAEVFNTETLCEFFGQYNIVFTDVDKLSGKIVRWRSLKDSTFLKHGFVKHPERAGVLLANLDKVSVEGAANWIRDNLAPDEATLTNAQQALELAFGWGPDYYEHVRGRLRDALRERNMSCDFPTWYDVDSRCFD